MQTKSQAFDDLANLLTNAFGAAKGVGDELRTISRSRLDKIIAEMDLVSRDEFEVMKEIAAQSQADLEAMKKQITSLKSQITKLKKAK